MMRSYTSFPVIVLMVVVAFLPAPTHQQGLGPPPVCGGGPCGIISRGQCKANCNTDKGEFIIVPELGFDNGCVHGCLCCGFDIPDNATNIVPEDSSTPCQFPFIFQGVRNTQCIDDQDGKLWCSTKTDNQDNHIPLMGHWKYCTQGTSDEQNPGSCGKSTPGQSPWPWMVQLNYFSSFHEKIVSCEGTLIAKRWVLTAANCFRFLRPNIDVFVKIGFVNLKHQEPESVLFSVTQNNIITHHEFSATTLENDIALVHLPTEVTLSHFIQIICLGTNQNIPFSGKAFAAGWGPLKSSDLDTPNILHDIELDMLPEASCKSSQHFICTFSSDKDTCMGNSGGPLMVLQGDRWYQVGIASHGPTDCGTQASPGVYTRVPNYIPFISSNIRTL